MADELEDKLNEPSEVEGRIKNLSKKTSEAQSERDEANRLRNEAEAREADAQRKATFYKEFSKLSSEYKDAPDFADEIEAKVVAGYSPKDATVSVLMEKGKFSPPTQTIERPIMSGGSAATNIQTGGNKTIGEMTREERRAALMEAEMKGDIGIS